MNSSLFSFTPTSVQWAVSHMLRLHIYLRVFVVGGYSHRVWGLQPPPGHIWYGFKGVVLAIPAGSGDRAAPSRVPMGQDTRFDRSATKCPDPRGW